MDVWKPEIFEDRGAIGSDIPVVDDYEAQLKELFMVRNPQGTWAPGALTARDRWVHYPWLGTVVHVLGPTEYYELFTSRNRDLITVEEQATFAAATIGIVGMSVGSSVALACALEGTMHFRLADFDMLSLSNLNRVRSGIASLGLNKAIIAARQIYELNPYADIVLYEQGLTREDLGPFAAGCTALVDEMDDVGMKIALREEARHERVPVVQATDNGDGAIVDVERFDAEPERELFHGALRDVRVSDLASMPFSERLTVMNRMVGEEHIGSRMRASLERVGKDLHAWPQLGGAAMISGGVMVYVIRRIVLGEQMNSGKFGVALDAILGL
jgi:hypothetical protein